jgi:hypothetical protein
MPTPTTDFSIFDGQELVTYDPATGPAISNVPAVRRPLTQSRMRNVETLIGPLQATDFVYHLDASPLSGATLEAGDTITDAASDVHQVLFVERQTLNNTVAAVCRPPAA